MAKGINQKDNAHLRKHRYTKRLIALLSILLLLSLTVGGVLAYLMTQTENVENRFTPASVTCQVNANNDGTVDVTNKGNVDAYIRAAIVVNWMDASGNVRGIAPVSSEYTLMVNSTNWWPDTSTGYYYYKESVNSMETTDALVTAYGLAANVAAPDGYELSVEVVAEAIQAAGVTDDGDIPAYKNAWEINSITGN